MRGSRLGWAVGVGLLGWLGVARAEASGRLVLDWSAPAECPSSNEVTSAIERLIGHEARLEGQSDLEVRAEAVQDAQGLWHGCVATRLGDRVGKRVLEAESCRAVAHATALIVALMIDPDAAQRSQALSAQGPSTSDSPNGERAAAPRRAATSAPRIGVPPARHAERAGETTIRYRAGLLAALDVGTLPSAVPGGGADLALLLAASSIRARALGWATSSTTIDHTSPPVGGRFNLVSMSLAGCPGLGLGRFDMGLCAEVELDWLKGRGTGVEHRNRKTYRWLSLGAGAAADVRLGRGFRMNAQADLLVPLGRSTFVLEGITESNGEVHRTGPMVARAGMGFGYVF